MAKTKVLKKTHPISELDAKMKPEVLARAKKMAEEESLNILDFTPIDAQD